MLPIIRREKHFPSFLDDLMNTNLIADVWNQQKTFNLPSVNILENKTGYIIEVAAPGLDKEDFDINIENNLLTISSSKNEEKEDKNEDNYHRREFCYLSFSRSFSLPTTIEINKIEAKHKNGVLIVNIPKKEENKENHTKKITIK